MNIKEDRFSNKSAEEIVSDVLAQHKDNANDALDYTKNILNSDGFSDETKKQLQKAADMLITKIKEENLNETFWPFKHKEEPKYDAVFEVYVPFLNEPKKFTLKGISSLDDPRIEKLHQAIRKIHPKSPIRMRSELGNKTFYENVDHSYVIEAMTKDKLTETMHAGNLPIAMNLAEKLFENDKYSQIDISKDNNKIGTYKGSKLGWNISKNDKSVSSGDTIRSIANSKTANALVAAGLSAMTGISPLMLTKAGAVAGNYVADKIAANNRYKNNKQQINQTFGVNEANDKPSDEYEDNNTIDRKKDVIAIKEYEKMCEYGINPELKGKPVLKAKFPDKEMVYVTLAGISDSTEKPKVFLQKKERQTNDKGKTVFVNAKDEKGFEVTVDYFLKNIVDSPENADVMRDFNDRYGKSIEYLKALGQLASQTSKLNYLNWIEKNWDKYNLEKFDETQRANLYLKAKYKAINNLYKNSEELSTDDIKAEYLPTIKSKIKNLNIKDGDFLIKLINNGIRNCYNENKRKELQSKVLDLFTELDTLDKAEIQSKLKTFVNTVIMPEECINKINSISNDALKAFETKLYTLGNKDLIDDFEAKKTEIAKSYLFSIPKTDYLLPNVKGKEKEIKKRVNDLINSYETVKDNYIKHNEDKISKEIKTKDWEQEINNNIQIEKNREDKDGNKTKVKVGILDDIKNRIERIKDTKDKIGYSQEFKNKKEEWKDKYGTEDLSTLEKEIKEWYKQLQNELPKAGTITKKLTDYAFGN